MITAGDPPTPIQFGADIAAAQAPGEDFGYVAHWLDELVWTAEEGIALLAGLRPIEVESPKLAAAPQPRSLDQVVADRTRAISEAVSVQGRRKATRLREYRRWKRLWDLETGGASARPSEFIDWAWKNRMDVPWGDWAVLNRLPIPRVPGQEQRERRVLMAILAGICRATRTDSGATDLSDRIRTECDRLGTPLRSDAIERVLREVNQWAPPP